MKTLQKGFILFTLLGTGILFSCGEQEAEEQETPNDTVDLEVEDVTPVAKEIEVVCIWDGVPIREEPKQKGKWLSSISLGEVAIWNGEVKVDSSYKNREFYSVKVSDGTSGWAPNYGLIPDAQAGAVTDEAPIYKRPDVLTITKKTFAPLDMVAITQDKEGFYEVIGQNKSKKGWVTKQLVTTSKEDVATAILATKKMQAINKEKPYYQQLEDIIRELPYQNSIFIQKLRMMADEAYQQYQKEQEEQEFEEEYSDEEEEEAGGL